MEETEFEPFFTDLEAKLSGKNVALFGSYGWGDGEWMRDWEDRVRASGAKLVGGEGLIINEAPDVYKRQGQNLVPTSRHRFGGQPCMGVVSQIIDLDSTAL